MQLASNCRRNPVGADEHVALDGGTTGDPHARAAGRRLEPLDLAGERQGVVSDRVEQRAMQDRAQGDDRVHLPAVDRHRHPLEQRAVATPHLEDPGDRSLLDDSLRDAELAERRHGVGRECERESQFPWRGGALENAHVPAAALERESGRKAADASARHESPPRRHASAAPDSGADVHEADVDELPSPVLVRVDGDHVSTCAQRVARRAGKRDVRERRTRA